MSDNKKKTVLVTGASRGIGLAIAKEFASNGYSVYVCCKTHIDMLEDEASKINKLSPSSCMAFSCDVGNEQQVSEMFKKMKDSFGYPEIVINNAGIAHYGLLTDMTLDEWHKIMSVNLDSLFYVCKKAIPHMLSMGHGKIINISSVWGNVGASCEVAYSASKGAVNSFTKALAKELAPSNIQVNAISCGVIDTEMNSAHLTEEEIRCLVDEIPADRLGSPKEVAQLSLQLSSAPSYLTGQIITLDGGFI